MPSSTRLWIGFTLGFFLLSPVPLLAQQSDVFLVDNAVPPMIFRDFMFVRNPDFLESNPFPRPIHINEPLSVGAYFKLRDADPANFPILYFILEGEDFGEVGSIRTESSDCIGFFTSAESFFEILPLLSTRFHTPGPRTFTLTAELCDQNFQRTGQILHRRSFTIQVQPAPGLKIRASIGSGAAEPQGGVDPPATAHFPLGSNFTVLVSDDQGNPVGSTFTLGSATLASGVDQRALFPASVAIKYTVASSPHAADFQAVHRGSVPLTITPTDTGFAPAVITLIVEDPIRLGSEQKITPYCQTRMQAVDLTFFREELDPLLYDLGHRFGIPPHFIKGHIE